MPFVKKLAGAVTQSASKVRILLEQLKEGRKCRFDRMGTAAFGMNQAMDYSNEAKANYGNNIRRAFTYKALNRFNPRGSAADQAQNKL